MKSTDVPVIFIIGTLTLLVFVSFLILIVIEYRKRQVRHITEKLKLEHKYQKEVLQTQLEVQEQTFKYLSEEIHDNIAQTLSLVKLKLYKTAEKTSDEMAKSGLASSTELLGNALNDLRNLSHTLNGGLVARLSLRENIENELKYVGDAKDIDTVLTITGSGYELSQEKKLLTFRIVQEAISNAIKHGEAKKIIINLAYHTLMLTIEISDTGKGFDTATMDESKGLGLHNIHTRASMLGNVTVRSEKDKGTTIILNINTNE